MDMNDPRIMALLTELQGLDAQDENISRKREWADALRGNSMQRRPNSTATLYGQTASVPAGWAGVADQLVQGMLGGMGQSQANAEQERADKARGNAASRWMGMMNQGNADVPSSPGSFRLGGRGLNVPNSPMMPRTLPFRGPIQ